MCVHMHTHTNTHVCMHTHIYAFTYMRTQVCMREHTLIHMSTTLHIDLDIQTLSIRATEWNTMQLLIMTAIPLAFLKPRNV